MLQDFAEICALVGTFLFFLLIVEAGYRLGRRMARRDEKILTERSHLASLQSALFGLMSLLLGFAFAMASSRFDSRKSLLQQETDAIAGLAMRAELLEPDDRTAILNLLKTYTDARIAYSQAGNDRDIIARASSEGSKIREALWAKARQIAYDSHSSPGYGMFIPALDNVEVIAWKRHAALKDHVPFPVVILLVTVASGALGFLAFNCGLSGPRRHVSTSIFILMISSVLFIIVDLDQPRTGLIQVSEESLIRLRDSLNSAR